MFSEVDGSVPFPISADDSTDVSAHEQLSISARYIINISHKSYIILNEKFITYVTVTDFPGKELQGQYNQIVHLLVLLRKIWFDLNWMGQVQWLVNSKGYGSANVKSIKYSIIHTVHHIILTWSLGKQILLILVEMGRMRDF